MHTNSLTLFKGIDWHCDSVIMNFGNKVYESMYRHLIVILPLLFILSQKVVGQVDSSDTMVFSGIIIDDSLEYALPNVHLWNESTRSGTISNDSGEFSIKARIRDTVVFSSIGYFTYVMVVSSPLDKEVVIRLRPKKYEIGEVVVRRFRSYESFIYEVVHHELPETKTTELREYVQVMSTAAALEADRERAIEDKMETGRFGYITPLGKGIDREKAFKEKIDAQKKRERVIHAKFNRVLVGDITQLEGDELTEFIAFCNFSEDYLYETDLYTIIENLYAKLDDYQNMRDTIPSFNEH